MILIFDTSNNLVMASSDVPFSHEGNDYTKVVCEDYNSSYSYSLVDGIAVRGDLIPIDTDEVARLNAEFNIENAKTIAKQYLESTDWYVTRKTETGEAIPSDIITKRAQARIDASS
tara:strand:- start:974 stop:1321 length:348 start_codon:yes stop_codon:yes gene_type:complete